MRVRLTRKLADRVDGIDLRNRHVGQVLDVEPPEATLLVLEQWAIPERRYADRRSQSREELRDRRAAEPPGVVFSRERL